MAAWYTPAALILLIAAFPPVVFTSLKMTEGLKISLGLFMFYFFHSALSYTLHWKHQSAISQLVDIPVFFGVIWSALRIIPKSACRFYEIALLATGPLMTVTEAIAVMDIALSIGPVFGENITELSLPGKLAILGACVGAYTVGFGSIAYLAYWYAVEGTLSTASSAAIAVTVTLLVVLSCWTVASPHGLVTDSALLTLYVAYNLAWCASQWSDPNRVGLNGIQSYIEGLLYHLNINIKSEWLETLHSLVLLPPIDAIPSVRSMAATLMALLSPRVLCHIGVQLMLFIIALKVHAMSRREEFEESEEGIDWKRFALTFMRPILVAVCTYAWLVLERPTDIIDFTIPSWIRFAAKDQRFSRWIGIVLCLAIYAQHLLKGRVDAEYVAWRRIHKNHDD